MNDFTIVGSNCPVPIDRLVPAMITAAGEQTTRRFIEFFTAHIRNPNTRRAYAIATRRFCRWCEERGIALPQVSPVIVASYIEQHSSSPPTVKQHLAALRMLFDWLVVGHSLEFNPASSVRGPKYITKKGKTPVLATEDARRLLDSIDVRSTSGLRDRALLATMLYTFCRVGAATAMNIEDFHTINGRRWFFRLHEKGGKLLTLPAHHKAEEFVHAYLADMNIMNAKGTPLFRTVDKHRQTTSARLNPRRVLEMIKRRAQNAGLAPESVCCHTFRATGITAYLRAGGTIEKAAAIAAHESTRTTQLYNRSDDEVTLDEIERIVL